MGVSGGMNMFGSGGCKAACCGVTSLELRWGGFRIGLGTVALVGAGRGMVLEYKSRASDMELEVPCDCEGLSLARKSGPMVARRDFSWSADRPVARLSGPIRWWSGVGGGCGEIRRCN